MIGADRCTNGPALLLDPLGLIEAVGYHQTECFAAGVQFARAEGVIPAPEANHAVKGAIGEALRCKQEGKSETILFNLCGHGHFDMQACTDYFAGNLVDQTYDEAELATVGGTANGGGRIRGRARLAHPISR